MPVTNPNRSAAAPPGTTTMTYRATRPTAMAMATATGSGTTIRMDMTTREE